MLNFAFNGDVFFIKDVAEILPELPKVFVRLDLVRLKCKMENLLEVYVYLFKGKKLVVYMEQE